METLILFIAFFLAMILEILTDVLVIKKIKLLAHLTQVFTYAYYFCVGVIISFFHPISWNYLWLLSGFIIIRIGFFNLILNLMMGWDFDYIGDTDYFDKLRKKSKQKIIGFQLFLRNKELLVMYNIVSVLYVLAQIIFYPFFVFLSIILFNQF